VYPLRWSQNHFFSVAIAVTHMVLGNVVTEPVVDYTVLVVVTPMVGSPMAEVDKEEEPIANHDRSNKSLLYRMCHIMNLLEDLRGPEGQLSLMTTRFMLAKKFK
jgi:hypothetical protein